MKHEGLLRLSSRLLLAIETRESRIIIEHIDSASIELASLFAQQATSLRTDQARITETSLHRPKPLNQDLPRCDIFRPMAINATLSCSFKFAKGTHINRYKGVLLSC